MDGSALPLPNLALPDGWTAKAGTYPSTVDPSTWNASFGETYVASPDGGTFIRAVAGAPNFRNSSTPDEFAQPVTGLVPGRPVKVEFWATIGGFEGGTTPLVSGPGFWQVSLGSESSGGSLLFDPSPDATRRWTLVSLTFTPQESEATLRFRATRFSTNANAGAYLALDGVRIGCTNIAPVTPTPTATATTSPLLNSTPGPSTATPTVTATPTSSATPTAAVVITATATPTLTPTVTPTITATPMPLTPTATVTATPTATATSTPTATPTATAIRITPRPTLPPVDPTSTPRPTATPIPEFSPTPTPTVEPASRIAELRFSNNQDRQFAVGLDGRNLRTQQPLYIFLAVLDNERDIANVNFQLDGRHVQTRGNAPWDLLGQNNNGAIPYRFLDGDVGEHELIAVVRFRGSGNGPEETRVSTIEAITVYAQFEVNAD